MQFKLTSPQDGARQLLQIGSARKAKFCGTRV